MQLLVHGGKPPLYRRKRITNGLWGEKRQLSSTRQLEHIGRGGPTATLVRAPDLKDTRTTEKHCKIREATVGFEPTNKGFAILRLSRLATSPSLGMPETLAPPICRLAWRARSIDAAVRLKQVAGLTSRELRKRNPGGQGPESLSRRSG